MNAVASRQSVDTDAAAFVTTHWSVVLAAQGPSPAADEALEKLCRSYWRPIYAFVRRKGGTVEDAEDLTQGFFALLLERRDFSSIRREKGRLRSYLLGALKHFLANERRRQFAKRRGEGRPLICLDGLCADERAGCEPADHLSADQIYEHRWAVTLLQRVFERLEQEHQASANGRFLGRLRDLLSDEAKRPSQAVIAAEFGMTENAVKQAFHRVRERYRQLLREEIAHTVATPADIEDELRHLISVLRT
jgi:RNA polymerase sigma-70 factor (ECF subfamily)